MDYSALAGAKIFITGATGLIGRTLVRSLLCRKDVKDPIEVVAWVRNEEKAHRVFADLPQRHLHWITGDMCDLPCKNIGVDYIVHCAGPTASKEFVVHPTEVIMQTVTGAQKVLEFARKSNVKSMVYLSTMEIYGTPHSDAKIEENCASNLDTMQVRSSYPESKRLCENLCVAYAAEYGVPVKVARLTQTFGEGVEYHDARLFAELARCVIEHRDIVLHTKGETKRNYLYTGDAAEAILTVLLYGTTGEAYNVANENTYCSVYELACKVADTLGKGIKVRVEESENVSDWGYAPVLKMNLSAQKLSALGFRAQTDLLTAFEKMISDMKANR